MTLLHLAWTWLACTASVNDQEGTEPTDDRLVRADRAFRADRHTEALRLLEALRGENRELGDVHRLLAQVYFKLERFDDARSSAVSALEYGRFGSDLWSLLATLDRERGRDDLALEAMRILVVLEPDDAAWTELLAESLQMRGAVEEATSLVLGLIQRDPADATLEVRLGNLRLAARDDRGAIEAFERAYWLGHLDPQLPRSIAQLWQQLDQPTATLAWYSRAHEAAPDDTELALQRAQAALRLQRLELAETLATQVVNGDEPLLRARAEWLRGQIAYASGEEETALERWEGALASGLQLEGAVSFLANAWFRRGEYERAMPHLRRVVDEGSDATSQALLVRALLRTGQVADARSALEQYVERFGVDDVQRSMVREWVETTQGAGG